MDTSFGKEQQFVLAVMAANHKEGIQPAFMAANPKEDIVQPAVMVANPDKAI